MVKINEKINLVFNSPHLITLSLAMLSSAVIFAISISISSVKKVGTIRVTQMIEQFVKNEVNKHIEKEVIDEEVKVYAKNIEKNLNQFAVKHKLILMPKEAVIAGASDYTSVFIDEYKQ